MLVLVLQHSFAYTHEKTKKKKKKGGKKKKNEKKKKLFHFPIKYYLPVWNVPFPHR